MPLPLDGIVLTDQSNSVGTYLPPPPLCPGSYGPDYVMRQNYPINVDSSDIDVIDTGKKKIILHNLIIKNFIKLFYKYVVQLKRNLRIAMIWKKMRR